MPITVPGLTAAVIGGLVSGAQLGMAVPQLAAGVAAGVQIWVSQITVITIDAGSLGSGTGVIPFAIPPPLMIGAMLAMFPAAGILGIMSPLKATGLANGLVLGLAQGLITTVHPTVGVGTGVVKLIAPPALPALLQGFAGAGLKGPSLIQEATAISNALMMVVNSFTLPTPIVGSASPAPGGGVGTGKIL